MALRAMDLLKLILKMKSCNLSNSNLNLFFFEWSVLAKSFFEIATTCGMSHMFLGADVNCFILVA